MSTIAGLVFAHLLAEFLLERLFQRGNDLEEIAHRCPDLTWNQIFLEIDRLSRKGDVVLNLQQRGHYSVKPCMRHS